MRGVAAEMADGGIDVGTRGGEGLAVRRDAILEATPFGIHSAATHDGLADDQRGALRLGVGLTEGVADLFDGLPIDGDHAPVPSAVFGGDILGVHLVDLGGELDVVRVVIHDEVVQPEVPSQSADALRDFLFDATVRDVGVRLVSHPFAEASHHEAFGDGCAEGHGVSLPQRARGVLDAMLHVALGVAGGVAAPLAEILQLRERHESSCSQHAVEHGRHVSGVEEEAVAVGIVRPLGVVVQKLGKEYVDEIGAAHGATGVSGFGFFHHRCGQDPDVVRRTIHVVGIHI